MICPKCNHENPDAAAFCMKCGSKLENTCPKCGIAAPPEAAFCMKCGAKLTEAAAPAEPASLEKQFAALQEALPYSLRDQMMTQADGETRLVSVLFADMSGSVKTTIDLHPEDAAALVDRLFKAMVSVLSKYEGRIDRFLGDGVLAVFGTPHAHENDPERAIRAALEIRQEVCGA